MDAAGNVADGKVFGGAEVDQSEVGESGHQIDSGDQIAGVRKIIRHQKILHRNRMSNSLIHLYLIAIVFVIAIRTIRET